MFERFTERARQVVVLAQDEARSLGHNVIGTEHLLLGLIREEEGIAARTLDALGVALPDVRALVQQLVGSGGEPATGQIPFTPRAKKTLELSLREALALGHNHVGTEHILLALVRNDDGAAARALAELGVAADEIRETVLRLLGGAVSTDVGTAAPRRRQTWRYRVERMDPGALRADRLDELAAEGWELASTFVHGNVLTAIFKRPGA